VVVLLSLGILAAGCFCAYRKFRPSRRAKARACSSKPVSKDFTLPSSIESGDTPFLHFPQELQECASAGLHCRGEALSGGGTEAWTPGRQQPTCVALVCDSFQFVVDRTLYTCPVRTPKYLPPELMEEWKHAIDMQVRWLVCGRQYSGSAQ
jgi:hypothetical protein